MGLLERFASRDVEEETDLGAVSRVEGATPMDAVRPRMATKVAGVIVSLTRSVPDEAPQLSVDVSDGKGVVTARFLGRRAIPGIATGRALELDGRFCDGSGDDRAAGPVALNPSYRLLGR
ncbi:DNA-binding protein [Brevibacterium litoralis]|uniref:DNA-binding protein n=1 Tax=Brevibacterium litoralis TaxID=3138935 RepID=UPI0032EB2441